MKKLASIFVSIIYLVLSTGVLVNLHYCQGEIESISIITNASKCCCASMDFADGCCSNEQLLVQLDNDEQLVTNSPLFSEVFKFIETESFSEQIFFVDLFEKENYSFGDLSPPPKIAIWKSNCTFLFYG